MEASPSILMKILVVEGKSGAFNGEVAYLEYGMAPDYEGKIFLKSLSLLNQVMANLLTGDLS